MNLRSYRLPRLWFVLTLCVAFQSAANSQNYAPRPAPGNTGAETSTSPNNVHISLTECEGEGNCANWILNGTAGTTMTGSAKWANGEVAKITVVKANEQKLIIQREDVAGPRTGLVGTYTGEVTDKSRVAGEFTQSWNGHTNVRGNWYAVIGPSTALTLPSTVHMCLMDNKDCATYELRNGKYYNFKNLAGQSDERRILTVQSFTPESIIFQRVDYGSYPLTATIYGNLSADGNRLENGMMRFTSFKNQPKNDEYPIEMTWGTQLESLPGDVPDGPQASPLEQLQTMVEVFKILHLLSQFSQ